MNYHLNIVGLKKNQIKNQLLAFFTNELFAIFSSAIISSVTFGLFRFFKLQIDCTELCLLAFGENIFFNVFFDRLFI